MKLTARLALSQLKVNKRRTIWTLVGIVLSSAMLMTIYGLGFGTGMDWIDRISHNSEFRTVYFAFISGIATVMSIFVLAISVIVISNAFRVSANERMMQFGILKSTGATKSQIMQTVVYEGLFLTTIGIPIGILIGVGVQFISVGMMNDIIEPLLSFDDLDQGMIMHFIWSWGAVFLAIGISFLTIFLSAWLPARKAAAISAISAIRGIGEVQIKNKKVRGGTVVKKAFGVEGTLARTFLKRSKRNFRATVIAISFSVAIFIVAGGFFDQMMHFSEIQWGGVEANVGLSARLQGVVELNCDAVDRVERWARWGWTSHNPNTGVTQCFINVEAEATMVTTADFQEINGNIAGILNEGDSLVGLGMGHGVYGTVLTVSELAHQMPMILEEGVWGFDGESQEFSVQFIVMNETFAYQMAELAGVPVGSNILLNQSRHWMQDQRVIEHELLDFNYQTLEITTWDSDLNELVFSHGIELHGQITPDLLPAEFSSSGGWPTHLRILVPETSIYLMEWWIQTEDSARISEEGGVLLYDVAGDIESDLIAGFIQEGLDFVDVSAGWIQAIDVDAAAAVTRNTMGLVMFFVFAFVGVLILIGLTNVISTISENVKTRAGEFAVLQSVGMTGDGIKRMLNLESVFSSLRALIVGVPIGILGNLGVYLAMTNMGVFSFSIPWLWIISSVIAIFLVTWATMRYSAGRLKNQNIIETIRSGSGM